MLSRSLGCKQPPAEALCHHTRSGRRATQVIAPARRP
jgi:hypothetical protein